ncbi:polycystin-1-related protein-like [Saccostrea cucullata]|uniref:polycystin-1-related protein-like n=1 Tax=Saccostrea cuccullata TaxID=36930 RepID=UPI002ED2CC74
MTKGSCQDVDECISDLHSCPVTSTCMNTKGSYHCRCYNGYFQSGPQSCTESSIYNLDMRVQKVNGSEAVYSILLNDSSTYEFKTMAGNLAQVTDHIILDSMIHQGYLGTSFYMFEPGSIVSHGNLYYEPEVILSSTETELFAANSTSAYQQYSIELSELNLTDVDECLNTDLNDCSEYANCSNTPGKYNCTCFSQYLDISQDADKPGRICAAISDQHKDPILGLVVETDRTHYIVSESANVTVRLSRGSHVTYNISYGDGSTERRAYSDILSFLSAPVFTHKYTDSGMYNLTVLAVNDISHEVQSVMIAVVDDIKNLNLKHTSTNASYDGQKRFELRTPKTLRNIKVAWDFGNGFEQQKPMSVFSSSLPLAVDHYYSVGNKFVRVNISNERTNQVIEEKFYIEEKISGLEVTCSSYITEPLNTLYLKVSFQTGSNVTVYISYGDGNKLQSVLSNKLRGEFTNYYPFVYSNIGKYNVSVRIVNTYSDVNITSPYIHVETPINNLLLSTGSVVALPPGEVKLLLSFTGSELEPCCMNCSTYIKGVFQQMDEIALINKDKPTEFLVVWQNNSDVGTADIEMLCKNKLGNQTFNTWTTFQRKIEQVYISTSQTSISVGGSITVKFDIGVGSHIQYQYDLGNGIRDSVNLPNSVVSNHSVSVTSSYQQMGVYEIKFNVSNLVSSVIKSVKVKVLEEIKGLKLSRYYKVSDLTETTHHGHGSDGDIFPLERPVIFEAVVSSGNEIIYTWKFGSENGYVTSDAKVMYKFQYVGSHLISVNVSNGLYFEYKEFSITLEEIVNPYSLKNNGPKMAFDLMTFTLKLSNPGTNPCYLWFMGDFSTIIIYGENVCREKAQLNNYEYRAWNVSNEIRHQHMYKTNGTFNVKVTGFNVVSSQSISNIGVITGVNCYYPVVHIIGGGQRIDEPVAMYRSEWINLESSAEINCPATSGPEYHWKIFKIQQGNTYLNRVFSSYDVNVTSTDHFKILFPPITFTPGLYRISLNVSMIGIPGMFSEHYTYLNITKTPLVVRISGGTARNIGYDSNLTLNAHEMTYDPDSPATSNFTFEWRCRKENEVFPSVIDYVTIPTRDEDLNQTRLSGCFGTGIGKLPISSGIIKVSTLFLDPHSKNVFEVYVRKDTREGTFQQTVEVTEGEAPLIQILCVENCNSKMNPSSQFSVQGKCLSCNLYEKVEYDWSLLVEESGEFQDVNELDSLLVTDTKSSVLVFKSSTLTGGRTYRLRLSASVYGYSKSFTEYEFITNLPPYGGSCGINPTSGYALETEFIISCNDWVNPGEEDSKGAGLLYRFWSKLRGRLDTQLLYYGTDPYTPDTTFPLGPEESDFLHDVVVRIANPIGEYVETWLSVKVSKPIIKNEVSELISLTSGQDSTLENLLSSGKTQEAKQVIVAVASLINTSPTEIGISRASVIKSNDKVISTTTTSIMTESTTSIPGTTEVSSDFPITAEYDNITTVMPTVSSTTPKATTLKITSTITTSTISTTSTEHLTTYIVGTTLDPAEVEAEKQRKEAEEKKKRIQLRESLLTTLSAETTSLTMDSLQQTALCFRVVTHESSELSETSQDLAVKAMKDVANSFQKIVSQSQTDSTIQKYSAAEDILACLSSVIIAATGEELSEIQKINEKEGLLEEEQSDSTDKQTTTTTTTTPASNIGTTEAPGTTKSPEQIKLESKQKVRTLATKVFDVAEVVYKTVIQDRVPGEPPVVLESQLFTIVAERLAVNAVNNTQLDTSTGSFQMPEMDTILSQNTSYVDSKVLSSKTNPYVWDSSAKFINTPVLTLNLYDSDGQEIAVKNLNDNITIDISVDSSKLKISEINFPLTSREKLSYHFFTVRSNMSSVHIIVKPEDPETKLECYVGIGRQPTIDDYDSNFTIPRELAYSVEDASLRDELEHTIFLSPEYVQERGIGNYYLGVRPVYNETEEEEYPNYDDYYSDYGITTPWDLLNYTISFVTSGCFYWDVYFDKWVSDGCQVSYLSNSNYTRCLCNHLTSFGSDFFVPPNTINFMTVFNDFESKLRDNWAVLAVLCLMYFLYTVGLFWARYKDKRDVIKWGIAPLADNVVCDKFFYQLTVCTGMRRGAGTKSKISFVLAGETQDTGVRELIDEKGIKTCGRGSINNFVLSTSEWLGPLTFIRIWHDNTGEGKYQGWYLSKIIVTDLQTSETYCFLCNRWLAVEEDDGMIDRLLPVASKEDMTNFQNLFMTKTKKSFTDSHLWISVFSRPHRSTFTRVQRLSCILSLVMTTLMVNAMFYQAEDKVKNKEYLSFGPFEFSLSGIYISFVSSMIVLPVNIIIDQLFRKSKPKRNRITNAFMGKNVQPLAALSQIKLRPWSPPDETKLEDYIEKPYLRPDSANSTYSMHSDSALIEKRKKNSEIAVISNPHIKPSKKKSKKFMLPHSCVYVAYTLVYISALLSSFITFLYSIEWGKEKSLSWLSSILLSICESVIVIQPFKIILVAMLLSIILKKPDIEEETETSEESQMNNQLLSDEELLYKNPVKSERPALKIEPPDKEKLAEAREKRMKEIAMFEIVREIAFYFVFVALIVLVASHNRDKKAYQVKEALDNIISINKVNQRSHVPDFWNWLLEILLPRLYISKQWNNMPVDDNEKRMIATRVAYRVGPVRIRQQRVKQEECNAVPMMYKFIETCSQEWSVTMEDDATYTEGWKGSKVNQSTMLMNYPWKHRSLFDDAGLPFSGEFGIYTGGGYIADLIGDRERAMKIAKGLMLNNWINQYTRAIFIEFTVYNPYVNMFSNVFIAFEMPTMGKMMIKESVKTFRLFSYLGGYGVFVVLCELSTLAIVIYFIVREVKVIKQQRKKYFRSFWNCLEIFNMICAVVAVSMYIVRHMITQLAMHSVKKLRDKFYNFQKVAMWDEVFGYFMAFTIFVSIIKLLHLFRFNKRMSMIAGTLKYSTKELSAFSVVIIIVVIAFASWGYIMFGPKMFQYRNMFQSIETMLAFALGDFDYLALERVNRVFGPIYFFTFILCIMIVLLNVFVTILNESISAVKSDVSKQSNEHEIVAFIWGRFKDWVGVDFDKFFAEVRRKYMLGSGKAKTKEKAEDIEAKLRDISKRLEQLGKYDTSKMDHPPPDMNSRQIDDVTKELLFTRLFPTMKHQTISLH